MPSWEARAVLLRRLSELQEQATRAKDRVQVGEPVGLSLAVAWDRVLEVLYDDE